MNGREGGENERSRREARGARAGIPNPRPNAPPPHHVYETLQAAEINSGASPCRLSASLGQRGDGVRGRHHLGKASQGPGGWMSQQVFGLSPP